MDVLFADLSPELATQISTYLREENIPFQITDNGTTIRVPSGQKYSLALQIASGASGVRFRSGDVGFEVFDKIQYGMTDRLLDIQYQRALTGHLQRAISSSPLVSWCHVQLTIPEEALFREQQKPPQGSVMLKLRADIGQEEVRTIQNLVSAAVPALKPAMVTVTDTEFRTLSSGIEASETARLTVRQQDIVEGRQQRLATAALQQLIPVVGPGNASVQVAIEMDFDEVTEKSEEFGEPVTLSEQEQKETRIKTTDGGVPGVDSNAPNSMSASGTGGIVSKEENKTVTTNNEIPRTERVVKEAPGKVIRKSISALINRKAGEDWPTAQISAMEGLIKEAVGFLEGVDSIRIEQFDFARVARPEVPPLDWNEAIRTALPVAGLVVLSVLAAVMLYIGLTRPIRRVVPSSQQPKQDEELLEKREELSAAELGLMDVGDLSALPPEDQRRIKLKAQVGRFSRQKPSEVAHIVKTWLSE